MLFDEFSNFRGRNLREVIDDELRFLQVLGCPSRARHADACHSRSMCRLHSSRCIFNNQTILRLASQPFCRQQKDLRMWLALGDIGAGDLHLNETVRINAFGDNVRRWAVVPKTRLQFENRQRQDREINCDAPGISGKSFATTSR